MIRCPPCNHGTEQSIQKGLVIVLSYHSALAFVYLQSLSTCSVHYLPRLIGLLYNTCDNQVLPLLFDHIRGVHDYNKDFLFRLNMSVQLGQPYCLKGGPSKQDVSISPTFCMYLILCHAAFATYCMQDNRIPIL